MKKYFKLPMKIILHNKLYWMLVLVMAFSTAFLGIIENVSKSMSEEAYNEQKSIYGSFRYIAYIDGSNLKNNEFGAAYVDEIFLDKHIKTPGYIYKLGFAEIDGFIVDFGYLNDKAWDQSEAKIIRGELPKETGEIALSDTKISELSSVTKYDVGSDIEVNGRIFTISGIYEEFGARWSGSNSFRLFSEVDAMFCKEETERIWNSNNSRLITILMDEKDLFTNEEMQDVKNIFSNIYITEKYAKNMYQLPGFILPTILLMSFLLIGSILMLIGKQRKAVNAIYIQLGIRKSGLIIIQSISFLICYIVGLVLGVFCTYGITSLLIRLQNIPFAFRDIYLNWNMIFIMVTYLTLITIIYFGLESKSYSILKKSSPKNFTTGSFILSGFFCVFMFTCSVAIMWEYNLTSFYQQKYEKENLPNNAGEMDEIQNMGYDFELFAVNTTSVRDNLITTSFPDDESGIYYYNNYMHFGIDENDIEEFGAIEGVSYTKHYKENDNVMLHINGDQISDYIDASDFFIDGKFIPRTLQHWENSILEYYGLKDQLLVNSKLLGCAEDDLAALGKYLVKGSININKLTQGEEVVLVAPRFTLSNLTGNQTLMKRMLPGTQDDDTYFTDTSFSVGDRITFYVLQPQNTNLSFGAISGSDVMNNFDMVKCEARIGAIIYDYTGWFSHDKTVKPYTLIVNHDAFTSFGLFGTNTRLRIYTDEDADEDAITKQIYKTYRDINSPMELENKMRSERIHKRYLYFLQTIKSAFTSLSAIAFFAVLGINIILQILYHKRTIGLLLLNGLSLHSFFLNLIKVILKIWILSMFVFGISFYAIMNKELGGIVQVINMMWLGGLVLMVQISALIPCYIFLKRRSIIQLLK